MRYISSPTYYAVTNSARGWYTYTEKVNTPHNLEYYEGFLAYIVCNTNELPVVSIYDWYYPVKMSGFLNFNFMSIRKNIIDHSYSSYFMYNQKHMSYAHRADYLYRHFEEDIDRGSIMVQVVPATCIYNTATDRIRSVTPNFVEAKTV